MLPREFLSQTEEQVCNFVTLCILSLQFYIGPGKEGTIVFESGAEDQVYKDKNGQLTVVSGSMGQSAT